MATKNFPHEIRIAIIEKFLRKSTQFALRAVDGNR